MTENVSEQQKAPQRDVRYLPPADYAAAERQMLAKIRQSIRTKQASATLDRLAAMFVPSTLK